MSDERPIRRLLEGVRRFHDKEFPHDHVIFEHLMSGQHPHTLFITCADSRIVPELITQTAPGELFVCRNIGNIVPPYSESSCEDSAVIEYACIELRVSEIVVCGHSDCGGMKGLHTPAATEHMPAVTSWLRNAAVVRDAVRAAHSGLEGPEAVQALVEQNVRTQLANLRTHPAVAARIADRSLELYGWVYDIGAGSVGFSMRRSANCSPWNPCWLISNNLGRRKGFAREYRFTHRLVHGAVRRIAVASLRVTQKKIRQREQDIHSNQQESFVPGCFTVGNNKSHNEGRADNREQVERAAEDKVHRVSDCPGRNHKHWRDGTSAIWMAEPRQRLSTMSILPARANDTATNRSDTVPISASTTTPMKTGERPICDAVSASRVETTSASNAIPIVPRIITASPSGRLHSGVPPSSSRPPAKMLRWVTRT